MGKLSKQRHNRTRMTLFNIFKATQHIVEKDIQIENLKAEVINLNQVVHQLKEENAKLCFEKDEVVLEVSNLRQKNSNLFTKNEEAIDKQKDVFSKKDLDIRQSSPIKTTKLHKQDLPETKQSNVEPDNKAGEALTTDAVIKYMNEHYWKSINTAIREGIQDAVSLVPNLPSQPP